MSLGKGETRVCGYIYICMYVCIFIYTCRQPLKLIAKADVRLHILPKQYSSNEAAMICLLIR